MCFGKIKLSSSKNDEKKKKNVTIIQESDWERREHFRGFCLTQNDMNLLTGYEGKADSRARDNAVIPSPGARHMECL